MSRYERANDPFISVNDQFFSMRSSSVEWSKRSESFEKVVGYSVFARRLELCLRAVSRVETLDREGFVNLLADLKDTRNSFLNVRKKVKAELSESLEDLNIIDCGAGVGSIISFIEWADLPYPRQLVLVEPNFEYFNFIKQRIEKKQDKKSSLIILSKRTYDRHAEPESVIYEVQDERNGNLSELQVVNSSIDSDFCSVPVVVTKDAAFTFIGVSKYYKASEFRDIVNVARKKLTIANIDRIVFNAQGAVGVLSSSSLFEQNVYIAIKKFYQTAITGKPNLHNFYTKEDLDSFEQEYTIVHNFGHSIIVCLA